MFWEDDKKLPFNLEYLESMASGDHPFMLEVIQMYVLESTAILEQMENQISRRLFKDLSALAHKLKSSTKVMGAAEVHQMLYQLEQAARKEEGEKIQHLWSNLKPLLIHLIDSLTEYTGKGLRRA